MIESRGHYWRVGYDKIGVPSMPLTSKTGGCTLAAGGPSTHSCWASLLGGLSKDEEAVNPEAWPNDLVLAERFPRPTTFSFPRPDLLTSI